MAKKLLKLEGQVTEVLANVQFLVKTRYENKEIVIRCYLNGKMRQNKIKVTVGDIVEFELPTTLHIENAIGRITYRIK